MEHYVNTHGEQHKNKNKLENQQNQKEFIQSNKNNLDE